MKKFILAGFAVLILACSTEREEIVASEITEIDLVTVVDECTIYEFEFGSAGNITVRNFHNYVEVTVTATDDLPINELNLHFAENVSGFPTTGNGKLNPSQLMYENKFKDGIYQFSRTFTFEELSIEGFSEEVLIAAHAEFGSGKNKVGLWSGDLKNGNTDWSYFSYLVTPFKNYAGTDQVREISLSDAIALPSWDEVRKVYAGMLYPGVNRRDGKYSPGIWDIINDFNDPKRESMLGEYKTTYTLGTGDCSDSVELTLIVVPDPL